MVDNASIYSVDSNRGTSQNACWPRTLASVSVASTKVVLSIQSLGVAESRGKVSSGLRYVGWVT